MRASAAACALGGLLWATKAVAVLATGDQPPVLFELAPAVFAVGLLGMRAAVAGRLAAWGAAIAWATLAAALPVAGASVVRPGLLGDGGTFGPLSPLAMVAGLGPVAGLAALGAAGRRQAWGWPAVALAAGTPVALAASLPLQPTLGDGAIEVALLAVALGWIGLGALLAASPRRPAASGPGAPGQPAPDPASRGPNA